MNSRRRWRGRGLSDDPFLTHWTVFKNGTTSGKARIWKTGRSEVRYQLDFIGDRSPYGDLPVRETNVYRFRGHVPGRLITIPHSDGSVTYLDFIGGIPLEGPWRDYDGALYNRYFPRPGPSVETNFGLKAMVDLMAQFPEEISILNFLWELRELPALILQTANKIRLLVGRYPGISSAKDFYRVLNPSEAYLAWEFGWKPLIQDLVTLWGITSTVKKRLDFLRKTQFGVFDAYSGQNHSPASGLDRMSVATNLGGYELRVNRHPSMWRLRAHCRVQNNLAYIDEWQGLLRAILGTLGFTNPAKVVWNAMPFSFVIDWLVNVSGWLSAKLNAQDVSGDWTCDRLTWSIGMDTSYDVLLASSSLGDIALGSFQGMCYRRFVGLPVSSGAITTPNSKQASLLAAISYGSSRY